MPLRRGDARDGGCIDTALRRAGHRRRRPRARGQAARGGTTRAETRPEAAAAAKLSQATRRRRRRPAPHTPALLSTMADTRARPLAPSPARPTGASSRAFGRAATARSRRSGRTASRGARNRARAVERRRGARSRRGGPRGPSPVRPRRRSPPVIAIGVRCAAGSGARRSRDLAGFSAGYASSCASFPPRRRRSHPARRAADAPLLSSPTAGRAAASARTSRVCGRFAAVNVHLYALDPADPASPEATWLSRRRRFAQPDQTRRAHPRERARGGNPPCAACARGASAQRAPPSQKVTSPSLLPLTSVRGRRGTAAPTRSVPRRRARRAGRRRRGDPRQLRVRLAVEHVDGAARWTRAIARPRVRPRERKAAARRRG